VLVSGASSGIGRETSILLAELGATVILVARNRERLQLTQKALAGKGHSVESFDLATQLAGIPDWMKGLAAVHGPLHGVVHCAGVHVASPLRASKPEEYDKAYGLNVVASAMLARGLRQKAVRADPASIVFISSVSGLAGTPVAGAYSASKGALIALGRSLAVELAPEGIRVNCIAPGFVQTEMTEQFSRLFTKDHLARIEALHPLGFGTSRDVAHAIAFLLGEAGRWITGITLVVDGGYTAQ
jgi:NAD(P)-dependent dehydrogenase (short-subunit alcohol dehydrogenase family)